MTKIEELMEKRANTDEFNRFYYAGDKTDTTLERIAGIELVLEKMRENRMYQVNILCEKKIALRDDKEMDSRTIELFMKLQNEMDELTKEFKESIKHIGVVSAY